MSNHRKPDWEESLSFLLEALRNLSGHDYDVDEEKLSQLIATGSAYKNMISFEGCFPDQEKEVEKFINTSWKINWSMLKKLEKEKNTLYCSFCGKSHYAVSKLIAGPTVFICDECVGLTFDIIEEEAPKYRVNRSLKFSPESRQAGMAILNYFGKYLSQRYPDIDVIVNIEQEGSTIRMIIQSHEGDTEIIEKTLHEYALVVTGRALPGDFLDDKFKILELERQIELAKMELKWAAEQKKILYQHNEILLKLHDRQANHLDSLNNSLQLGLTNSGDLALVIQNIANRESLDSSTQILLNHLLNLVTDGLEMDKKAEVEQYLETLQEKTPSVVREIYDFCKMTSSSAAGSLLANWIAPIIGIFPKM